jgi:hypothetical protein
MPMNRDGQNRMDGFLHAAADMDSARPDVQFYREHYRSVFGGSGTSSAPSGDMVPGIVVLGLIFGLIYAFGFVAENWQIVLVAGGALLALIAGWAAASFYLANFHRTALTLLVLLWISSAIWFGAFALFVVSTGQYETFQDFLAARRPPLGTLLAVPVIYAPVVLVFSLTRLARRKRSLSKSLLLANVLLIAAPALIAAVAGVLQLVRQS